MIICHKSFSQKSKNEARDIEEIKLIFRDFPKLKLRMPLYIELHDTVYLHPYFTSYKEYFDKNYKNIDMLPEPVIDPTSKNLTEEDKKDLE